MLAILKLAIRLKMLTSALPRNTRLTQFKTEREQERLAQLQEVSALAQVEADKKNKEAASAEKKRPRPGLSWTM